MIPLFTAAQVKRAEEVTIQSGVTEAELMLRAGAAIADFIEASAIDADKAVILCGPGNNGGDGLVIASQLIEYGWNVSIWSWSRDGEETAPVDRDVLKSMQRLTSKPELHALMNDADVVVDAVFGAGSRAQLPDEVVEAFDIVREVQKRRYLEIWAVDLPSGLDADSGEIAEGALHADVTAMIGLPKIGAYKMPGASFTGEFRAIDIGLSLPDNIDETVPYLVTSSAVRPLLPQRRAGVHKRSAGSLLVVGGAPNYYGAPRLAGEAALRTGAGLVSVAAPSSIISSIATAVPELTFVPLPVSEHPSAGKKMASIVRENESGMNAMVIGPGLGTDAPIPEFLAQLLGFDQSTRSGIGFGSHPSAEHVEPFSGRAVLDADALNWLSGRDEWWTTLQRAELVLTPHAGELGRLLGIERGEVEGDPWKHALDAARKFGQVVVLKHAYTVIAAPDGQLFVANRAPIGLATAGTGDVLSGMIGAFLAQGLDPRSASVAAVELGLAAVAEAEALHGRVGYLATDIIREIPASRERIQRPSS